jgi:predicted nuclease of predicted toxin-antitoxin system
VKILVDVNLTPTWVEFFAAHQIDSIHWSTLGDSKALDSELMAFARENAMIVFTHDLDFGSILAVTQATGPSVIQARVEDPVPAVIGPAVVSVIREHATYLQRGALITLDPDKSRIRILPIVPGLKPQ